VCAPDPSQRFQAKHTKNTKNQIKTDTCGQMQMRILSHSKPSWSAWFKLAALPVFSRRQTSDSHSPA